MIEQKSEFQKEEVTKNLYRHIEHLSVKIGERHLWQPRSFSGALIFPTTIPSGIMDSGPSWSRTLSSSGTEITTYRRIRLTPSILSRWPKWSGDCTWRF